MSATVFESFPEALANPIMIHILIIKMGVTNALTNVSFLAELYTYLQKSCFETQKFLNGPLYWICLLDIVQ